MDWLAWITMFATCYTAAIVTTAIALFVRSAREMVRDIQSSRDDWSAEDVRQL